MLHATKEQRYSQEHTESLLRQYSAKSLDSQQAEVGLTMEPGAGGSFPRFMDLPLELREAIWRHALPESRVINVLVYAFPGFKLAPLNRGDLKLALPQVCYESRRVFKESGYILAFRDDDDPHDVGIWFNHKKDVLERTIWGPGEVWGL